MRRRWRRGCPTWWTYSWAGRWTPRCQTTSGAPRIKSLLCKLEAGSWKPARLPGTCAPVAVLQSHSSAHTTGKSLPKLITLATVHSGLLPCAHHSAAQLPQYDLKQPMVCRPHISAAFESFHAGWKRHSGAARRTIEALVSDLEALPPAPPPPAGGAAADTSGSADSAAGKSAAGDAAGAAPLPAADATAADPGGAGGGGGGGGKGGAADARRLLALLSCVVAVAKGCGTGIAPHMAGTCHTASAD